MVQRTAASLLRAETLVKRALEIDSGYLPAWLRLAQIYQSGAFIGSWLPEEAYPRSRAAALEVLRLDTNNARARAVLSTIARSYDFDMEAARREQDIASALAPGDSDVLFSAAVLAFVTGDYAESIRQSSEAEKLDPLYPRIKLVLGHGYFLAGRLEEAISAYGAAIALTPAGNLDNANYLLGCALLISGDHDGALKQINKEARNGLRLTGRALVLQAMGDTGRSRAELDELITLGNRWSNEIARVHAYRGELDEAFTWLDRAIDRRDPALNFLVGDPFLDNLREDPRFQVVLARLGRKTP